jgi:hypothetical protein
LPCWRDDQPEAAELLDVVALHLVLGLVGVVVQRMVAIRHLDLAVGPLRGVEEVLSRPVVAVGVPLVSTGGQASAQAP